MKRFDCATLAMFLTTALGICLPTPTHAYILGTLSKSPLLSAKVPTHVVVAGTSDHEANLFVQSAMTRARRYRQLYPNHQVIVFSTRDAENGDLSTDPYSGLTLVRFDQYKLTSDVIIKTLLNFKRIQSLDLYGHAVLDRGFNTDDGYRLRSDSPGIEMLRKNFTREAFATIHACNSGFLLAPELSRIWNIPVAGMLTGSDFQVLHTDGHWYFNNRGESPAHTSPARSNSKSFSRPVGCADGGCVRMMPTNAAYTGKLGAYEAGLGFMKFFCDRTKVGFFGGIREKFDPHRCEKNMALALVSQPTVNNANLNDYNGFVRAALDFLCPSSSKGKDGKCAKALLDSLITRKMEYSSFRNPDGESVLECNFMGCNFNYENVGRAFRVTAPRNSTPRTQVTEFWNYLYGFGYLK